MPTNILKSKVKKSLYLYPIVHRFSGNKWSKYTNENTDICLEGYPSSANSFVYNVVKKAFEGKNVSHHTHTISNVKKAIKLNVPTLVLIRSPKEAISSRCVRFEIKTEEAIIQYYEFYKFIEKVRDKIFLLCFEEAVNKTSSAMREFEEYSKLKMTNKIDGKTEAEIKKEISKWSKKNDKKTGSLPSEKRYSGKQKYKKILSKKSNYGKCEKIYKTINGT